VYGCSIGAAGLAVSAVAFAVLVVRPALRRLDKLGNQLDAQTGRLHFADKSNTVEFAGHRISSDAQLETLDDGQQCAHIAVTATSFAAQPVRIDQFAFGIGLDLGRPTPESAPTDSSTLVPASVYGLESTGRICARPRIANEPMALRWHAGGTDDPVGIWSFQKDQPLATSSSEASSS
jgi:hypothetical protein